MGMIVCKPCYETNLNSWIMPFNQNVSDPERTPDYNENVQHYSLYTVEEIASKLQNGEMLEIICSICKMTHVGKDPEGNIKVRYAEDPTGEWKNYV